MPEAHAETKDNWPAWKVFLAAAAVSAALTGPTVVSDTVEVFCKHDAASPEVCAANLAIRNTADNALDWLVNQLPDIPIVNGPVAPEFS